VGAFAKFFVINGPLRNIFVMWQLHWLRVDGHNEFVPETALKKTALENWQSSFVGVDLSLFLGQEFAAEIFGWISRSSRIGNATQSPLHLMYDV
jgi:hypothetical protein